ncbi:hypothetical protein D3C80_1838030 [compost metagenome]
MRPSTILGSIAHKRTILDGLTVRAIARIASLKPDAASVSVVNAGIAVTVLCLRITGRPGNRHSAARKCLRANVPGLWNVRSTVV